MKQDRHFYFDVVDAIVNMMICFLYKGAMSLARNGKLRDLNQARENKEKERLMCPKCGKRALDINAKGRVELTLKCPNCKNFVDITYKGLRPAV